ncbi:MAG: hypothetical protein H6732_10355 [Alphaproteobacteria bacterium]|nr:hypothetical protein [Alphaproteobacteria bacterium]
MSRSPRTDAPRPLSWTWVGISFLLFTVCEVLLGFVVGEWLLGGFTSHMLRLRMELFVSLGSYLLGGFVVGLVSPGLRLLEPAVGAALSVVVTYGIAWFTPVWWYRQPGAGMLVGAVIAFGVGLYGAHLGERVAGNRT